MTIQDIKNFITVYDSKSINHASKSLFISPQGLAKNITKMEEELSITLFNRSAHGMHSTPEADLFYNKIRPLISAYDEVVQELHEKHFSSLLRVKFTSGILSYLSLDFLKTYRQEHPRVELLIDESADANIKKKLLAHECDLAVMSGPIKDERICTSIFTRTPVVAVVNENHRLASNSVLSIRDLDGEELALLSHRSNTYWQFLRRLTAANVTPAAIYETDQLHFNHQRAQLDNCIGQSFASEADYFNYPGTIIIPFDDPSFTWNTYFCWLADSPLGDIALDFKDFTYQWLCHKQGNPFITT